MNQYQNKEDIMYLRTKGMLVHVDHIPQGLNKEEQKKWQKQLNDLIESARKVVNYEKSR